MGKKISYGINIYIYVYTYRVFHWTTTKSVSLASLARQLSIFHKEGLNIYFIT